MNLLKNNAANIKACIESLSVNHPWADGLQINHHLKIGIKQKDH